MEKKTVTEKKDTELMHGFGNKKSSSFSMKLVGILLIVVILGVGTGYALARTGVGGNASSVGKLVNKSANPAGKVVGSDDLKTFKDTAEGVLKEGGVEGEGQYHLVRPGGESQNVYMTSSLVDLSEFIDRKIKVWGQTQKAEKVGWLMDVGRVQVLD